MFEQYTNLNPQKILLIRSSAKLFPIVVEELKKVFPEAELYVLSNGVDIEGEWRLLKTNHSGGFYWRDIFKLKNKLEIDKLSFDMAVVLYNSNKGYGYLNIDTFAFAVKSNCILAVNLNNEVVELKIGAYILKIIYRVFNAFWLMVNFIMSLFVFFIIFIFMLVSVPFILLNKNKRS